MVDRIFHVSDIHIRIHKRHQEYKETFDRLFKDIEENKTNNSIIIVTGDIVHSKLDTSPDLFDTISYFFNGLSKTLPTYIILGNHDLNLKNKTKLDPITPVVDALGSDNLMILEGTKHHQLKEGLEVSLLDVKDGDRGFVKANEIYSTNPIIALYHGIVEGSMTNTGFELDGEIPLDVFNGFDAVLLGDVHKFQKLRKNIAYPGSLIQQNFGEDSVQHGYIIWDYKGSEGIYLPSFKQVNNNHSFIVLDFHNTVSEVMDHIKYSTHSDTKDISISIRNYESINPSIIEDIIYDLKNRYQIKRVEKRGIKLETVEIDLNKTKEYSFSTKDSSLKSIIKYASINLDIPDRLINNLEKEVEKLTSDYEGWTLSSTTDVKIHSFKFNNMFSYGENINEISFEDISGLCGLFAKNASGKSTFFDSLSFAIFGKCSRTSKASEVMNSSKDNFECEVVLSNDNKRYKITKKAFRSKKGRVSVAVYFYQIDESNSVVKDLNGKDRRETEKFIKDVFGTYEDFIHISYSTQDNYNNFINLGQSDRKGLLSYFLNLDLFDDWHDQSKEDYKKIKTLVEYDNVDTHREHKINLEKKIEDSKKDIEFFKKEIKEYENKYKSVESELRELESNLNRGEDIDIDNIDIDLLRSKLEKREKQLRDLERVKKDTFSELKKLKVRLETLKLKTTSFEVQESPKSYIDKIHYETASKLETANLLEKRLKGVDKDLKHFNQLEYDPECEFCIKNLNLNKVDDLKKERVEIISKLQKIKKFKEDSEKALIQLGKDLEKYKEYQKHLNDINDVKNYIETHRNTVSQTEDLIGTESKEIQNIKLQVEKYELNRQKVENNKKLKPLIKEKAFELNNTRDSLRSYEKSLASLETLVGANISNLKETSEKINKLVKLEVKKNTLDYLVKATHKNGLPLQIMSNALPFIESSVNKILEDIVDFKVKVYTDGKNINVETVYDSGVSWDSSLSSGMERFILSTAFRTALCQITNLQKFNFMILDEGFGFLDAEHRSVMDVFLNKLKNYYGTIFCISHIESMKDYMDCSLELSKTESGTNIYLI